MTKVFRCAMRLVFPSVAALVLLLGTAPKAQAQISFGFSVGGPAPVCPYGYYDYAPYNCSPYGYYGSQWFNNGAFLGAGPWYRGPAGFRGYVNRRYDPRYGYRGGFPGRGAPGYYHGGDIHGFRGNQFRDGRGHGFAGGERGGGFNHGGGGFNHGGDGFNRGGGGGNRVGGEHGGGHGGHH